MINRELNDDVFDAILKHSLAGLEQEREQEAADIYARYADAPAHQPPARHTRELRRLAKERCAPAARTGGFRLKRLIPAVVAAALLLASTAAVSASGFDLFGFFFRTYPTHTEIGSVKNMEEDCLLQLSEEWDYVYFPANLPQGFSLDSVESDFYETILKFSDGETSFEIDQTQLLPGSKFTTHLDTENARTQPVKLGEYEGLLIDKNNVTKICYHVNDMRFIFRFHGMSDRQAIKIASDLKKLSR